MDKGTAIVLLRIPLSFLPHTLTPSTKVLPLPQKFDVFHLLPSIPSFQHLEGIALFTGVGFHFDWSLH